MSQEENPAPEHDPVEQEKPTEKPAKPGKPTGFQFQAGDTVAVRLTPSVAKDLSRISKKYPLKTKTELIEFVIRYTRKNHLW